MARRRTQLATRAEVTIGKSYIELMNHKIPIAVFSSFEVRTARVTKTAFDYMLQDLEYANRRSGFGFWAVLQSQQLHKSIMFEHIVFLSTM